MTFRRGSIHKVFKVQAGMGYNLYLSSIRISKYEQGLKVFFQIPELQLVFSGIDYP